MSLPVLTWVLEHSEAKLGARLVLLALAEFAHDDGSKAFPSNATLMRRARLSERGVRDALRKLEADRMIEQTGKTAARSVVYTIVGPFNVDSEPADSAGLRGQNEAAESAPEPRTQEPQENLIGSLGEPPLAERESAHADRRFATGFGNGAAEVPRSRSANGGEKPSSPPANPSNGVRLRDPIWDALVAIFGEAPHGMERGRWNKAAKSLRAEGATGEQVSEAARTYGRVFGDVAMTPTAIAANWTTLTRARDGPRPGRVTGWRFARGSHGSTYVPDPAGTDVLPRGFT